MSALNPIKTANFNPRAILTIAFILLERLQYISIFFFTISYQMVPFSQVWPIKQIPAFFLFSASVYYYRANKINYAAIIVWVCWYGRQSVICMCYKKKMCACL